MYKTWIHQKQPSSTCSRSPFIVPTQVPGIAQNQDNQDCLRLCFVCKVAAWKEDGCKWNQILWPVDVVWTSENTTSRKSKFYCLGMPVVRNFPMVPIISHRGTIHQASKPETEEPQGQKELVWTHSDGKITKKILFPFKPQLRRAT